MGTAPTMMTISGKVPVGVTPFEIPPHNKLPSLSPSLSICITLVSRAQSLHASLLVVHGCSHLPHIRPLTTGYPWRLRQDTHMRPLPTGILPELYRYSASCLNKTPLGNPLPLNHFQRTADLHDIVFLWCWCVNLVGTRGPSSEAPLVGLKINLIQFIPM